MKEPRQGPALYGVLGRPKASVVDYAYSDAMMMAGGVWTYDDLNSFIADPKALIPGTKMTAFEGIEAPERRAALIRYLRDLSVAPVALPD